MSHPKSRHRIQHKYLGLFFTFFILAFSISGIILNHREAFSHINISRSLLPDAYRIKNWNNGTLRGTLPYQPIDSSSHILIYGSGGVWKSDSLGHHIEAFNQGLPQGIDQRSIREMQLLPNGELLALNHWNLYKYKSNRWQKVDMPSHERLCSMAIKGDTLVILDRSQIFVAHLPSLKFHRYQIKSSPDSDGSVSLFRTFWTLHNGELFGTLGRLFVDGMGILFIILSITGLLFWWFPKYFRYLQRHKRKASKLSKKTFMKSFSWHNQLGRYSFGCLLFITITGWFLRPPLLIPIASARHQPIPLTTQASSNPWHDQLRLLRYDNDANDWILHTSRGFYSLSHLHAIPQQLSNTPPVSVMGINVMQHVSDSWIVGSFSGLYIWDRKAHRVLDFFTHKSPQKHIGPPVGRHGVTGYSTDFAQDTLILELGRGTKALPMPKDIENLPISLWHVALETHVGRIFTFLGSSGAFYIFLMGLSFIWILWTGWKIRIKKKKQKK